MRYGFISDVHGEFDALQSALAAMSRGEMDEVLCLGDVSGGSCSEKCLQLLCQRRIAGVVGNHDLWEFELVGLSSESREYLRQRPLELRLVDFLAVHSLYEGEEPCFAYIYSERDARAAWSRWEERLIFFGHTHLAQLHWMSSQGETGFAKAQAGTTRDQGSSYSFSLRHDHRYLVNVMAVKDGWVIYDSEACTVTYHFFRQLAPQTRPAPPATPSAPTSLWSRWWKRS